MPDQSDQIVLKKEKFHRIKRLRCYGRVHEMLSYGHPVPRVAKFIRSQGEYTDVKENSLIEMLKRYRREILPVDVLTTRRPHVVIAAKKQYTDKLEDLRRLDVQFEALLYRFDMAHAEERATGFIDSQVDRIQRSILETIRQMHHMKMDLGISGQRHLGTLTVSPERLEELRQKYGDGAARAMADPVSRARVLAYLRKAQDAASLASKKGSDSEVIDIQSE